MVSTMGLTCFYVSVMAAFVVPSRAFQASISITGNTEKGGHVAITCSWTLAWNEVLLSVQLRPLPVVPNQYSYYYCTFYLGRTWPSQGSQWNSRMSYDSFNVRNNRAIVRITNVQCSDERTYSCYFSFRRRGQQDGYYERTSYLDVKAPGGVFQGSIAITGNTEIRGHVTITCSWTLARNETLLSLELRPLPVVPYFVNYYYYQFKPGVTGATPGSIRNSRMSYDSFNAMNNRAIVRITDVQCSDKRNYSCYFSIGRLCDPNSFYERTSYLDVKVRSTIIAMDIQQRLWVSDLSIVDDSRLLFAWCAAEVDKSRSDRIQWSVIYDCVPEYIDINDSRVSQEQDEYTECTWFAMAHLRLSMIGLKGDIRVTCFLHNTKLTTLQLICTNNSDIPCMESQTIVVVPGQVAPQTSQGEAGSSVDWPQAIFLFLVGAFIGLILGMTMSRVRKSWYSESRTPSVQGKASSDEMSQVHEGPEGNVHQ